MKSYQLNIIIIMKTKLLLNNVNTRPHLQDKDYHYMFLLCDNQTYCVQRICFQNQILILVETQYAAQ